MKTWILVVVGAGVAAVAAFSGKIPGLTSGSKENFEVKAAAEEIAKKAAEAQVAELKPALVTATGDISRLKEDLRIAGQKKAESEAKEAGLREQIRDLKDQVKALTTAKETAEKEIARRDREKELAQEETNRVAGQKTKREKGKDPLRDWAKKPANEQINFIHHVVENQIEDGYDLFIQLMANDNDLVATAARDALSTNLDRAHLGIGKKAVALLLGAIKEPGKVPLLDEARAEKFRKRASEAMVNIGIEAVDDLVNSFVCEDKVRDWAMDCVAQIGAPAKNRLQPRINENYIIGPIIRAVLKTIEAKEKAAIEEAAKNAAFPVSVAPVAVLPVLPAPPDLPVSPDPPAPATVKIEKVVVEANIQVPPQPKQELSVTKNRCGQVIDVELK